MSHQATNWTLKGSIHIASQNKTFSERNITKLPLKIRKLRTNIDPKNEFIPHSIITQNLPNAAKPSFLGSIKNIPHSREDYATFQRNLIKRNQTHKKPVNTPFCNQKTTDVQLENILSNQNTNKRMVQAQILLPKKKFQGFFFSNQLIYDEHSW